MVGTTCLSLCDTAMLGVRAQQSMLLTQEIRACDKEIFRFISDISWFVMLVPSAYC